LTQARKIGDRTQEAELILNLGGAYRLIGDYPKAKELIEQGLKIARELKNPRLESIALNSLGSYYTSLNDYQKALSLAQQSLKIAQDLKSPPLTISPQFALGDIYSDLGDYKKSREFYQQALTTAQQLKNRYSEGLALFAQAYIYFAQGEPQKTVELSKLALTIFQEIKVPRLQAFAHRMLSIGYGELGNDAQAMAEAQNFLTFAQKTQNSLWSKSALSLLGGLHQKFGRKEQAIATYQQALAITTDNQIPGADAYILAGLARIYQDLNQPNIAIKYYKDSVNQIEEVRRGIQGLPPELQKSFLDATVDFNRVKVSDIYRQLAELLFSQKRDKEALYVQELLRGQEIRDFISTRSTTNKPQIPLTPTEKKVPTLSQSELAMGNQIIECEGKKTQPCIALRDKQSELIKQHYKESQILDKEIRENRQKDDIFFEPKNLGKIREIVDAQADTVMIYPFVREKELKIQLYGKGDVLKTISVPVGRQELGQTVQEFRSLMEKCEKPRANCGNAEIPQLQAASQKLYNWLIKPMEGELQGVRVKNLVFALDRVIRYVPMSALYDGKQYLIEKYTVYIAPSAELTDTKEKLPAGTQNTQVLAMGLSEPRSGFSSLPNVPKELDAIVRKNTSDKQGIYPGDKYLNSAFDFRTLRDNLKGHKILHLATHGIFNPESSDKSYILLGTGEQLTPEKIFALTELRDIHLVVLSACQTALASPDKQDGVEINALAYNFLYNKAKSVIASLWQVDDPSTAQLMEQFYSHLANSKTPLTKAEALRLAQLSLLYGKQVTLDDIKRGAINVEPVPGKPGKQTKAIANFAHPYYWAPFILIGNGL
ncbi:MAG: CHAT domain-containing protein, partial [Stigonema ocellatum SAG 48.90 = DSM 106950]|nr:CHAT domain-containing protein [Stigonema ocellatum SAG 48.90 = DSM 106950]